MAAGAVTPVNLLHHAVIGTRSSRLPHLLAPSSHSVLHLSSCDTCAHQATDSSKAKSPSGAGESDTQPLQNPMDLSCMVDSAYSMADWSMNPSSLATASYNSAASRDAPFGNARNGHTDSVAGAREADDSTTATLAALDSMYTALSALGFQQVRTFTRAHRALYLGSHDAYTRALCAIEERACQSSSTLSSSTNALWL